METLREFLSQPYPAEPLALFRITFGLLLFIFAAIQFRGRYLYLTSSNFYFFYELTPFIKPRSAPFMIVLLGLNLIASLFFTWGLFYHISAWLTFLSYSYLFFCDKAGYVNHLYLTCLILFLFCFVDASRVYSIDQLLSGPHEENATIPLWSILIFKIQILIVFVYAGLNKINRDWLIRAEPLKTFFRNFEGVTTFQGKIYRYCCNEKLAASIQRFLQKKKTAHCACWLSMIIDILIIPLIWWEETRLFAIPLYIAFHLFNHWYFWIGVFPYMNYTFLILFINPSISQKILGAIF